MSQPEDAPSIGQRLRSCRLYRGMSQQQLADTAGVAVSYVSMVENGQRQIERRSIIAAFAEALRVSPADLTGQPYPPAGPTEGAAHAAVAKVRYALLESSLDRTDRDPRRPVAELAEETERTRQLYNAADYAPFGRALPDLLHDLQSTVQRGQGDEPTTALRLIVLAAKDATNWLKNLGFGDLAWIAADRGHEAALRLEDPLWIAAAEFARAQALRAAGAHAHALEITMRGAEQVPRSSTEGMHTYEVLLRDSAQSAAITGSADPAALLAEAREVMARTGGGPSVFWSWQGMFNVDLYQMSVALENGEPGKAVEIARSFDPKQIPVRNRRAEYWMYLGHGLSQQRDQGPEAVRAFLAAEKLAPDRVRNNVFVRQATQGLIRRAGVSSRGIRDLRQLAHRMGVGH